MKTAVSPLPIDSLPPHLHVRTALQAGKKMAGNRCEQIAQASGLRVRTTLQAGKAMKNRCEQVAQASGLRVRTALQAGKAGKLSANRCEALASA